MQFNFGTALFCAGYIADAEQAFRPLSPVTFSIDRLETNPRFAAIARPANAAILVKLRIDMEDRGGRIELMLPYATLEPIRKLLLQQFMGDALVHFMLWPFGSYPLGVGSDGLPVTVGFQPWQLVSYGFMHGSFTHILFNGIALFQFGSRLEAYWGSKKYLTFFMVCVVGAGLCQLAFMAWMPESVYQKMTVSNALKA